MSASIISPEWLISHLDDPEVVIIDCRFSLADPEWGSKQYQVNHIPHAFYLDLNRDLSSPVGKHGGRHPLPNSDELAAKLATMGVKFQETLVVAYDDGKLPASTRLWWLLRYLGHDPVAILDGGLVSWQAAGYPVSEVLPASKPGHFVPQPRPAMVVDIERVKACKDLPGVVLIDSRDRNRYLGLEEPTDPIAGHIPGAVNYPWAGVYDATGKVRSVAEQQQRWDQVKNAKEIITYCGSGVTACVNLLSLELAGVADAKLYAGSWSDWCSHTLTNSSP